MANSGIASVVWGTGYTFSVEWTATQDTESNSSTISWRAYLAGKSGYNIISGVDKKLTVSIDGEDIVKYVNISIPGGNKKLLASGVKTIYHSSDGTKSMTIDGSLQLAVTISGKYYSSCTTDLEFFTLDPIEVGFKAYVAHLSDVKRVKDFYVVQGGGLKKAKELYVVKNGQLKKL